MVGMIKWTVASFELMLGMISFEVMVSVDRPGDVRFVAVNEFYETLVFLFNENRSEYFLSYNISGMELHDRRGDALPCRGCLVEDVLLLRG